MRADHVPPRGQIAHLPPGDETWCVQVVGRYEEVPAPAGTFEEIGDAVVRAGAAVVEREEHGRRTWRGGSDLLHHAASRSSRGHGREVPLERAALELVGGGGGAGKTARVPVARLDYVMVQQRKRSHVAASARAASSADMPSTTAGPTCPTDGMTCRSGRPDLRPRREASARWRPGSRTRLGSG